MRPPQNLQFLKKFGLGGPDFGFPFRLSALIDFFSLSSWHCNFRACCFIAFSRVKSGSLRSLFLSLLSKSPITTSLRRNYITHQIHILTQFSELSNKFIKGLTFLMACEELVTLEKDVLSGRTIFIEFLD